MNSNKSTQLKRPPTLTDEVARRLIEAIRGGQYKPGERLPTENQLCETYGVSRPVLREAISQLKFKGLVVPQQGRGVFVSESGFIDSFEFEVEGNIDNEQILQLLEVLHAVQVYCTGAAAKKRTKKQLSGIKKALDKFEEKISSGGSASDVDTDFHNAIVKATNNPHFISLNTFLEGNVHRVVSIVRNSYFKESVQLDESTNSERPASVKKLREQIIKEHEAIYTAIEEQDEEKARQAAEAHLREVAIRITGDKGVKK